MNHVSNTILVTCALPYANGPIHLGHMFEHIQADIWVRYHRMRGKQVYFICADDAHGTPIMLKAQQLGLTPEVMINQIYLEHQRDFMNFGISYDNYHTTHSSENYELSTLIYSRLKVNGLIKSRNIYQLYDSEKNMFLPDRFVKGVCPICQVPDQYGDNCESCGATYNSIDLINPISILSNTTPIIKSSEHFFFNISYFNDMLYSWIKSGVLQKQVANKIEEWFSLGLQQWDISRDAPYFGFEIPDHPGKYFYVWLDAPIGYIGAFKNLCSKRNNINFDEFWNTKSQVDLYHFIGKDIIYFHGLFWPAVLEGSGFRKPTKIFVHGHVKIHGKKIAKSKGKIITASAYLDKLDADCLRYYYATKLSTSIDDIDLNLEDFMQRVNTDVVNKLVNLAARNAGFITKYFNGQLANKLHDPKLYHSFIKARTSIEIFYNNREVNQVIKKIMSLTHIANYYIDTQSPWKLIQQEQNNELQEICSMGIELFRILMTYLKPVMPFLATKVENFLNHTLTWDEVQQPLYSHRINQFQVLFHRIDEDVIKHLLKELE